MSRSESQDFEYPPGLRSRMEGQREHTGNYQYGVSAAPYNTQDRRQLSTSTAYPQREYGYGIDITSGPNRNNASNPQISPALNSLSSFNHNLHRPSPPPSNIISTHPSSTALYHSTPPNDARDYLHRHAQQQQQQTTTTSTTPLLPASNSHTSRSTLWWGDLEPWMDEEYAKQVCSLMGWDPVNIKVPHPPPDPASVQQGANNPGYCFLTFPSHAHAAAVLAQINTTSKGDSITMPNSSKPFVLNWASSVPASASASSPGYSTTTFAAAVPQQPQYQKEYSIFVGDLAPETSNSDLVAVFRNPVLGLRNDREPKFIRPFVSCKSAKIMLDPVTGVSRGYGFVRFTDEADQQRALIEMHGLYCLSRPMRISPATAKHKLLPSLPPPPPPFDVPNMHFSPPVTSSQDQKPHQVTIALPLPPSTTSVSAPIAATTSNLSINSNAASGSTSGSSMGGSGSSNSLSSNTGSNSSITSGFGSATSSEDAANLQHNVLAQMAKQYASSDASPLAVAGPGSVNSFSANEAQLRQVIQAQQNDPAPRFMVQEEQWKHQAQARAILGNLIGPNGEQLTSTDPYNTTVFVGGLSPLISEETLRTFFAPFGEIHYVKVPVGKHCGFVQFVRKADAERAIEKMQGFPIGGSRIRLSWGRSQYKAAQAAAQAAQATLQSQYNNGQLGTMTQDQALQLLQKFAMQNYVPEQNLASIPATLLEAGESDHSGINYATMVASGGISLGLPREDTASSYDAYAGFIPRPEVQRALSNFSPFSPDPNISIVDGKRRDSASLAGLDSLTQPSKAFSSAFYPLQTQDLKNGNSSNGIGSNAKVSPTTRPASASRYGSFADRSDPPAPLNRAPGRMEAPISRPPSGQTIAPGDAGQQDFDPMYDLNHTLASLEINRSWKSSEGSAPGASRSSQFHLSASSASP